MFTYIKLLSCTVICKIAILSNKIYMIYHNTCNLEREFKLLIWSVSSTLRCARITVVINHLNKTPLEDEVVASMDILSEWLTFPAKLASRRILQKTTISTVPFHCRIFWISNTYLLEFLQLSLSIKFSGEVWKANFGTPC